MTTFEETTVEALTVIGEQIATGNRDLRYVAAYVVLCNYTKMLLVAFSEFFSAEQIAEFQEVLEQLDKLTGGAQA
jgi:hypothetical protein